MDLQALKGKTVDDTLLAQLVEHVEGLTSRAETAEGKARAAQKESIEGRKQLKAERDSAFEKLGVSSLEELEALPEAKGQAEAAKQLEAKLKKAERERQEFEQKFSELSGRYATERQSLAIEKALSSQPFVDMDDARAVFSQRVKAEGDDLLFETPEGKLVPLADGAAWLAKTKTHLVKVESAGGSGYRAAGGGGSAPAKGDFGGDRAARAAAIAARFPELAQ